MKKIILTALFSTISANAYATESCSKTFVDRVRKELVSKVYEVEKVLVEDYGGKITLEREYARPYPTITQVKECLETTSLLMVNESCSRTLLEANGFSLNVQKFQEGYSSLDPNLFVTVFDVGYRFIPTAEEMNFYVNLKINTPLETQIMNFGSDILKYDLKSGGYGEFFEKMPKLVKACRDEDDIPIAVVDGINQDTGYATIDIYKSGKISCTIIAPVIDSKVNLKVPDALKSCAHNSDAIVISVDQKAANGKIINKKIAGPKSQLTSSTADAEPKLVVSRNSVDVVDSILNSLDQGASGANFKTAVTKVAQLAVPPTADKLDTKIVEAIALCDYVVLADSISGPTSEEVAIGVERFIKNYNENTGEAISYYGSADGYYKFSYQNFVANLELFPVMKQSFENYKNGELSAASVWNWEGEAYGMCYMLYPDRPRFITDFILDGEINDARLIADWAWKGIPQVLFTPEAWALNPMRTEF